MIHSKTLSKRAVRKAAAVMGKKGGLARSANLTPEERSEASRQASLKRWAGHTPSMEVSARSQRKRRLRMKLEAATESGEGTA